MGERKDRGGILVYAAAILLTGALMLYAETRSFVWDEGFHLVAAQLIGAGKRPYLDFCFPQTPLNAYWNLLWMRMFGESWRVTHVAATLLTGGTLGLLGWWMRSRFPVPRWNAAVALASVLLVGLNTTVVQFGTIAQAYGMCMFAGIAAFVAAVRAVRRNKAAWALVAGIFAGVAASSSLLSAPVAIVLLLWTLLRTNSVKRWAAAGLFCLGVAIPFAPVAWLFVQGPRQTFFNIVQYQALFRRVNWTGATEHDVDVLSSWADSSQILLLGLLAITGYVFVRNRSRWERILREEFYLACWISAALVLYISTAHPTFGRYYIVAIPFLAIPGGAGFYWVASRVISQRRPGWSAGGMAVILGVSVGHALFADRDSTTWQDYEQIAQAVRQVTPPQSRLYADEAVYFVLHRNPPSGMEFSYSHKIELPEPEAQLFHVISERQLQQQVKAGQFSTFQTCDDDRIDQWRVADLYGQRTDVADCSVFWNWKKR